MSMPEIFVIAGPNGVGKTTSNFNLIPNGIALINSDEIAKELKRTGLLNVNTQEYSNREAIRLMNEYLERKLSFGIETNLADIDTWKFLLEVQKGGYRLEVTFVAVSNLNTLNERIKERFLRGEHYIRPDVVKERYINGLNLLSHYFAKPDKLLLIENSTKIELVADIELGKVLNVNRPLPFWVQEYLGAHFGTATSQPKPTITDTTTVDEVRMKYQEMIKGKSNK